MHNVLNRARDWLSDQNILYLSFFSVLMPYPITALVILFLGVYLLVSKKTRKRIFVHKFWWSIPAFSALTFVVGLCYKNFIGAGCSILYFFIMVIALFARTAMTRTVFERSLNGCCVLSIFVTLYAVVERLIYLKDPFYRCQAYFFNPNYLATIMATVIIICAYKITARKGNIWFYYGVAAFCAVTMYLCGSMFVWVELLMGVSVLLSLMRQHHLLSIFLTLAAVCCIILYCVPEIFPRLTESNITTDNRITIWDLSIRSIPEAPFFGRGFLSYMQISANTPGAYLSQHAHNLVLEPLLSFGIVGTILFSLYFLAYFRTVLICKNRIHKSHITALVLSLTAAMLIHGTTDMTMLWIQTGLFYLMVMAGVGADEKVLAARHERLKEYADATGA